MTRWAMVADLERCVGCQTCTAACRHANATSPAVQWRKVLDIEAGSFPNVNRTFVPVGCQHCADPPCMHVCPSTATRQRADGIVTIDYDICIGCAYCDVACPYQARFKITKEDFAYGAEAMQNEIEREISERLGVAQKCTFCSDRIDFGIDNGLAPGSDPRATPACVNACIADALHFGDLDDANSNVSRLLREHKSFRMHAELGTEPGFHYLYDKAAAAPAADIKPRAVGRPGRAHAHPRRRALASETLGLEGRRQFPLRRRRRRLARALRRSQASPASRRWCRRSSRLSIIACGLGAADVQDRPAAALHLRAASAATLLDVARSLGRRRAVSGWRSRRYGSTGRSRSRRPRVLGLVFLFCQGMILEQAKGIPAWRNPRVIALIMATGLAEGCGLYLLLAAFLPALGAAAKPVAIALAALGARLASGPGGAISPRLKAAARRRGRWKSSPPAACGFSPPAWCCRWRWSPSV